MGEVKWVIKNPETVKYYHYPDAEWGLIELFDGARTRLEIVEEYNRRYGAHIDLDLVLDFEETLRKFELIEQSVAERNLALLGKFKNARQRAAEEKSEGFNPFFLLFHVLDPNRFLDRTVKYVRWLWTPPIVAVWSLAAAWTVGVFALNFAPIWEGTYELYAFLHKPFLDVVHFFFILSFLGFFHEFGHAYATKIYGGEVHDIGIALLYFTPAFYCDTTDALLFQKKWQHLWVTTAGIYVEGFICSAATALWVASYPDTLLHELAYKTMLFTGISTLFFNINPLVKIDGYYALSSVLEIPQLREESFRYVGAWFQKHVLRLPVEVPAASRRKRRIYWIYGTLALAYLSAIMSFIAGLFYNFYSKYFADVAIILLLLTLYRIFRKRIRLLVRVSRLFYLDKKELLMSARTRTPLIAIGVALLLLLLLPLSRRRISAEAVLQPQTRVRLEAPEDGIIATVLAHEGDRVGPGQPIFKLASTEAEAEAVRLSAERDRFAKAASAGREAGAATLVFQAERRELSADAALHSDAVRQERLVIRSPIAGLVLSARLEDLLGRFVPGGTVLAEVGDCRRMKAELPVSERLLDDLDPDAPVTALARARPARPLHGRIQQISAATLEQPKTVRKESDAARPSDRPDRFVALAVFENPDGSLRPGTALRAKIYSRRASFASRVWRVVRRWIQTIIW